MQHRQLKGSYTMTLLLLYTSITSIFRLIYLKEMHASSLSKKVAQDPQYGICTHSYIARGTLPLYLHNSILWNQNENTAIQKQI